MKYLLLSIICLCILGSCDNPDPNTDSSGTDELEALEIDQNLSRDDQVYKDKFYVPIYSDIYVDQQNQKVLLAATLSIRNISYKDTLFVTKIDYFNTKGALVREFIDNPILIAPMATVNYVIERDDDTGGNGANFIVDVTGRTDTIKPLIQAVMIGQHGNKGFAFATDAYSTL